MMGTGDNTVRITIINFHPYWLWSEAGKIHGCTKLLCHQVYSMVHALQRLNFSVETVLRQEGSTGIETSPGNWTGVIGDLSRKESDMFGGYVVITPGLSDVVDYTTCFGSDELGVMSGPPMNLLRITPSLLSGVSFDVWILLGVSWVLVTCLYLFMSRAEALFYGKKDNDTLIGSLLTFYGLLFQRGFENLPDTLGRRILVTGWLLLVLVFTVELSGALSSKLATEDAPERIDKLADILKYPHLRPYVPEGINIEPFLQRSVDKAYRAVWKQIERHRGARHQFEEFLHRPELMDEIGDGSAVMIAYVQHQQKCLVDATCRRRVRSFYLAKEAVSQLFMVGLYRQGLDPRISEAMNRMFTQYGGMGFQDRLYREVSKYSVPCFHIRGPRISFKLTSLAEFVSAFKALGIGVLTSWSTFLLELVYFKITRAYF